MTMQVGDCIEAWQKIICDTDPLVWVVFVLSDDKKSISVAGSGPSAALPSVKKCVSALEEERKACWGGYRVTAIDNRGQTRSTRAKFIAFQFIPEACPPMLKAKAATARGVMTNTVFKCLSLFLQLDSIEELADEADMVKRLESAGGAHRPTEFDFGSGGVVPSAAGATGGGLVKSMAEQIADKAEAAGTDATRHAIGQMANEEQTRRVTEAAKKDQLSEAERAANRAAADEAADTEKAERIELEGSTAKLPAEKRASLAAINAAVVSDEAVEKRESAEQRAAVASADAAMDNEKAEKMLQTRLADDAAVAEQAKAEQQANVAEVGEKKRRTSSAAAEEEAARAALAKKSSTAIGGELADVAAMAERKSACKAADRAMENEQERRIAENDPSKGSVERKSIAKALAEKVGA